MIFLFYGFRVFLFLFSRVLLFLLGVLLFSRVWGSDVFGVFLGFLVVSDLG